MRSTRLFTWSFGLAVALGSFAALSACNSGEQTLTQVEPDAVPAEPDFQHVQAIMEMSCVPCHKGDGTGSQKNPHLDSCEGILANFSEVLRTVTEKTMPPGAWPRLSDQDALVLRNWALNSGACAPCGEPCP